MPSTGISTAAPSFDVMMTGRPDRNSARPRCTPTCLGEPNRPELPLVLMSPHTLAPSTRNRLDRTRTRPSGFYSIGDVFFATRLQSPSHEISWHDAARSESRYYMMTDGRLGKRDPRDSRDPENGAQTSPWAAVPEAFRGRRWAVATSLGGTFRPLRQGVVDELMVVGQCGQSIDARIATPSGHSHYINGEAGLAHLHRLRALVDAVVVGVGTAIAGRSAVDGAPGRGPKPGAGRRRSEWPVTADRTRARCGRYPPCS